MLGVKMAFHLCSIMELGGRTERFTQTAGWLFMFTPAKPLTKKEQQAAASQVLQQCLQEK